MPNQSATWTGGRTYVFQGTVLEDATAGTHVTSLTVVPGAGNEMQVLYGRLVNGNTATAQTMQAYVTDGTNIVSLFINQQDTSALISRSFPMLINSTTNVSNSAVGVYPFVVSGTQTLYLSLSTTAVSVTQTFAVVLRVWGDSPTFTLADTVGTPTLTTNTSGFF